MVESFVNAYWSGHSVVLLRRDEEKRLVERKIPAEYSFFVRLADFAKIEKECRLQLGKGRLKKVTKEGEFVRIVCKEPEFRYALTHAKDGRAAWLDQEHLQIPSFEADLHPVKRFLIDSECQIQKPIKAYFDLETDDRFGFNDLGKGRILCWSIVHDDGTKVQGVLEEDTDRSESELLKDFFFELADTDCLLAWNGDRFDFPFLKKRITHLKLNIELRRWLQMDHMQGFKKYNMHSAESGDEKDSVALERVAASLGLDVSDKTRSLNEVGKLKTWDLWASGGEKREILARRNMFDSQAMYEIEKRTKYIELHYAVCATSGVFPDTRALSAKNTVEGFVMRLASQRKLRFPSMWENREKEAKFEKFRGAYVMEVEPGIKRNVHVCDFSGMYPANIQSWNMSPETYRPELSGRPGEKLQDVIARLPPGHCVAPHTLAVFVNEPEGILPLTVRELKATRKVYNRMRDEAEPGSPEWDAADRLSQGCKITVNSAFGVASSPFSRLFVREVGESITLAGQWLIRETMKLGEERGIKPIAGDTDSTFAIGVGAEAFKEFVQVCNKELYPRILKEVGCVRNEVVLDYEKELDLMVSVAKKRYAGRYRTYKGKPAKFDMKPVIKGFEYKRGDSLRITRHFQEEVIRRLLLIGQPLPEEYPVKPEDFHDLIEGYRKLVLEGELSLRDVTVSKSLSKETDEYEIKKKKDGTDAAQPIHIQIAKLLEDRGENITEGTRIEYVITNGSPLQAVPLSDYTPGCEDREHYWLKLIWPPVERVLEACWPRYIWSRYRETPNKGGGKGKSKYGSGQTHMSFFWEAPTKGPK